MAVEKVEAAGVAEFLDLTKELGHVHGRVGRAACAQVLAVGVDQRRLVARGASPGVGFARARVPLDGVRGNVQPAGAFEEADAPAEQVVNLMPSLGRGARG